MPRIPICYWTEPKWKNFKIRNCVSCGHLVKHLVGVPATCGHYCSTGELSPSPAHPHSPSLCPASPQRPPPTPWPSCAESRRRRTKKITAGHLMRPCLSTAPLVTLLRHCVPDVTPTPRADAHSASTIPATGARRRPHHGHAEVTTWTPPRPASSVYKRHPGSRQITRTDHLSLSDILSPSLSLPSSSGRVTSASQRTLGRLAAPPNQSLYHHRNQTRRPRRIP
jgi:hypothetical protein